MLVPICSLYGHLAGALTFLYPWQPSCLLIFAFWHQSCLLFMPLVTKPLFQSHYPGLLTEEHQLHQYHFFSIEFILFSDGFSVK